MFALAVPPILTNAYAGVRDIDPAVRSAALAMGMTPGQLLRRVELPLALPLVMAGIRTAAVEVVATATTWRPSAGRCWWPCWPWWSTSCWRLQHEV